MDYGALAPNDPQLAEWTFGGRCAYGCRRRDACAQTWSSTRRALALTLTLINRIRDLEAEVRSLRAQLPRRLP